MENYGQIGMWRQLRQKIIRRAARSGERPARVGRAREDALDLQRDGVTVPGKMI